EMEVEQWLRLKHAAHADSGQMWHDDGHVGMLSGQLCDIRGVAMVVALVQVGLAPRMLQHDEIPAAGRSHHWTHAGIARVVAYFQFEATEAETGDAPLHFIHDGTFAEFGVQEAETDKVIRLPPEQA